MQVSVTFLLIQIYNDNINNSNLCKTTGAYMLVGQIIKPHKLCDGTEIAIAASAQPGRDLCLSETEYTVEL